jgi:putative ABC transport system ATP-binding protein
MSGTALLEARGLGKTYRQGKVSVQALAQVDLAIRPGELVVIAGSSGSGKSTLLHLLGGLDEPDRGQVLFEGADLATKSEAERTSLRRHQVGFVFQSFNLVPVLSAYENVEYGLWLAGVAKPERRRRVFAALEAVGVAERMEHRPDHLSGGERQRVALARALVHEPRVVLADEPTASLDSGTAAGILGLLLELAARGTTFVFATHDHALIERAPRIVRLVDGRIAGDTASPR